MTVRWIFTDSATLESETLRWNPNSMSSFLLPHNTISGAKSPIDGHYRAIRALPSPREFSFGGFIRTKEQHDMLLAWSQRTTLIDITDHLNRRFRVRFVMFEPSDKHPTKRNNWRMNYVMRCLSYGRSPE